MSDEKEQTVTIPVGEYLELLKFKPDGGRSLAVRTGSAPPFDREKYGKILWEGYRASLNPMLDPPYEKEVQWEWLDHERQVAIRDAAQHLVMVLSQNITLSHDGR